MAEKPITIKWDSTMGRGVVKKGRDLLGYVFPRDWRWIVTDAAGREKGKAFIRHKDANAFAVVVLDV